GGRPARDPYEVLGCSPGDSDEKIRKAYRRLVAKYHPDKFIGLDLDKEFVDLAAKRFQEVQEAYEHIRRYRGSL
ncbi:MAG TPA: J domain-containing protein, partial [Synergistales bacterium]|nr:J domain-containing protein [Synergistales bacterium]